MTRQYGVGVRGERDELAEILLRLLNSCLADPGPERSQDELRTYLFRWLVPLIEENLRGSSERLASSE